MARRRASLYGAVPLSWSLDHAGPLTRSVRDAAIVLRAISGPDPLDPSTEAQPVPDWIDGIERGPRGLRIGVPKQYSGTPEPRSSGSPGAPDGQPARAAGSRLAAGRAAPGR
jgi:Asp-tRNA(Asn)/Glu-tRNA(Gln) amidotransferase A subunit family amidase